MLGKQFTYLTQIFKGKSLSMNQAGDILEKSLATQQFAIDSLIPQIIYKLILCACSNHISLAMKHF